MRVDTHKAIVRKNDDPDQKLRIKVSCEALMGGAAEGEEPVEVAGWILPKLQWGWIIVPEIDEQVEIEVLVGEDTDEIRGQSSMAGASMRWTGVRDWTDGLPVPDIFKEKYGKRRGFVTPWGHVIMFDDDDGSVNVRLQEGATLTVIGKDASAKLTLGDGAKSVAVAEPLQAMYTSLHGKLTASDAHVHTTPVGPSGPPVPLVAPPAWDTAIVSTSTKIPG